jgi:hypothetical protein
MKWFYFIKHPYLVGLKVIVVIITLGSIAWSVIEGIRSEPDFFTVTPVLLLDNAEKKSSTISKAFVENEEVKHKEGKVEDLEVSKPVEKSTAVDDSIILLERPRIVEAKVVKPTVIKPTIIKPTVIKPKVVESEIVESEVVREEKRDTSYFRAGLDFKSSSASKLRLIRYKPWYSKLNYFVSIKQEVRDIDINRKIESSDFDEETLIGTYNATLLSLTTGGNLFKKTSFNLDLTLNRYELSGSVDGYSKTPVKYQRNKSLTELFIEYDLGKAYTLGFDLYYGGDKYKNEGGNKVHFDEEMGADFFLSRKFKVDATNARLDYIFGHRIVQVDLVEDKLLSRSSHNVLSNISYNFNYELSMELNTRLSYFPTFNEYNYWESQYVYSTGAEINYRLWNANEITLTADVMQFGDNSTVKMFAIRFEHLFGAKTSKRRQRRYKIPNLLIK